MIEAADKRVILIALAEVGAADLQPKGSRWRNSSGDSRIGLLLIRTYLRLLPTNDQHLFYSEQLYSYPLLHSALSFKNSVLYLVPHLEQRNCSYSAISSPNTMTMSSGSSSPAPESSKGKLNGLGKAFRNIDLDGHDLPPSPAPSSPRNGRKYALATELVYTEGNDQYNASSVPIYQVCNSPDRSISQHRMKPSSMSCSERTLKLFLYGLNVTDSPCP